MNKNILTKFNGNKHCWYIDEEFIAKKYDSVELQVEGLKKYPGIKSVTVLPIDKKRPTTEEEYKHILEMIESMLV